MGSPLSLHIPVPALGVRLLLLAAGDVHSGFRLIQLHQVLPDGLVPVSYTHLDVYKRQVLDTKNALTTAAMQIEA